jgi:cytochrome c553
MARQSNEASQTALELAVAFGEIERFWAQNKKADAVKWAQDARTWATQAAGAVSAGDIAKANQAAANMQGACKQCHGVYRETDAAGGYRIKPAALTP